MTKEEILALVKTEADEAIKEGFAPSIGEEGFSETIINELVEAGEELPESTRQLLFGLLVIFEMRHRNDVAHSTIQ